ncbi:MAG: BON domain-containing protein [Pseudomonadota bacterium]|nr:BON domain-containing protein [Pseudomonadota bacterium]
MNANRVRGLQALALSVAAATVLSACAPLLIGGAVVGGAMVATDRRTSGAIVEDETIELKGASRIREALGDRGNVSVTSYNRIVLLTGDVPEAADKAAAEQVVARVPNVRSVVNEVVIGLARSVVSRSRDAFLTSKVKASFIDARDLFSNSIKVVTAHQIVHLMGRVTEREATRAAEVARGVDGVQKVVRVFEIISESELANGAPRTVPAKP